MEVLQHDNNNKQKSSFFYNNSLNLLWYPPDEAHIKFWNLLL